MTDQPTNGTSRLEERITALAAQVAELSKDVKERQRFPWTVVISGLGVMLVIAGMLGGLIMYGISTNFERDRGDIDRVEAAVLSLASASVPRGEHERQWINEEQQRNDLQRQIDQMRADFGSSFSLNDTLKAIIERVDRLEQLRLQQTVPMTQ